MNDKIISKPLSKEGEENYERIFDHSKPKIDYSEFEIEEPKSIYPQVVNPQNKPVTLTSYQKNSLYKKAKDLKEKIRDSLCTKTECWRPTEYNVKKMIHSEFRVKPLIEEFKKCMKAIRAEPKDWNVERLRPRR